MGKKLLIQLIDGGLEDVTEDSDYYGGCETCDYGATYTKEICFYTTRGFGTFKADSSYDYAFSIATIMRILFNNLDEIKEFTEKEFLDWFNEELHKETGKEIDYYSSLN